MMTIFVQPRNRKFAWAALLLSLLLLTIGLAIAIYRVVNVNFFFFISLYQQDVTVRLEDNSYSLSSFDTLLIRRPTFTDTEFTISDNASGQELEKISIAKDQNNLHWIYLQEQRQKVDQCFYSIYADQSEFAHAAQITTSASVALHQQIDLTKVVKLPQHVAISILPSFNNPPAKEFFTHTCPVSEANPDTLDVIGWWRSYDASKLRAKVNAEVTRRQEALPIFEEVEGTAENE